MFEKRGTEIAALFLLLIFFPTGVYLIQFGNILYEETSFQPGIHFPPRPISFSTNITYANFTEITWVVATPYQESPESEWKLVTIRLGTIQLNYTLNIQFPYQAKNVRGLGYDLMEDSYVQGEDYYNLTVVPNDHIVVIFLEWRAFARWAYDTYSIEMPLYPFFYECGSDVFRIEISGPEKSVLDLSRTFPYPNSAKGEVSPTYVWETTGPQDIHESFSDRLRVFFVFPENTGNLRYVTYKAGIFTAFGVSMIIGGITQTIIYIINASEKDSWTMKTVSKVKQKLGKRETSFADWLWNE